MYSATFRMESMTRSVSSSASFSWEKYPNRIVWPMETVPVSGFTRPRMTLISVDLPQPFGPMMPILSFFRNV